MKNRLLGTLACAHALALLCFAGTAMAQAPLVPEANTQERSVAESIHVYRQLHGILSHRRCIIAHPAHQHGQPDSANKAEDHGFAEGIIEIERETPDWRTDNKCQQAVASKTP